MKDSSPTKQEIVNKTENSDSIEWRFETGKSVKVYGDSSKPEEFKQRLQNAIKILMEVENGKE